MSLQHTLAATTLAASAAVFMSCAVSSPPGEAVETNETRESEEKLPAAHYYAARLDTRRCAFPGCGGIFVSALNREETTCIDGNTSPACYVAELRFADGNTDEAAMQPIRDALGVGDGFTRVVLLGRLNEGATGHGALHIDSAWIASAPVSVKEEFYRVYSNGVLCVAAPCPSFDQDFLNNGVTGPIHGVVDDTPTSPTEIGPTSALYMRWGLVAAGTNRVVDDAGPAGAGTFLYTSASFMPIFRERMSTRTGG